MTLLKVPNSSPAVYTVTMTVIIETKNISKIYRGATAVDDVSFSVQKGEVVGFVGLNGAGKSTTINMLLGFQKPSVGEVLLFGHTVTLPNAHRSHHRIGFATGDMSLFDGMSGKKYLAFIARSYGQPLQTDTYKKLVQKFEPQLDKKLRNLSRGNKQKIALIAAFMTNPDLIILDEPSSGLDPLMQQRFLELVREASQNGTTIFMSSHYLNEVVDVCSRILLIKKGKLVKDISEAELEANAGKLVRVTTKQKVKTPKAAELIQKSKTKDSHTVQFVFKGKIVQLQEWLNSLSYLQDVSITDHSAEAAFEDLYKEGEPEDV